MNTYLWLVRREFWERRVFWLVPALVAGVFLLAALFTQVSLPSLDSPLERREFAGTVLLFISATFFVMAQFQATLYLLDCLYEDRRDRSVLFWKSLPFSDTETVLSKLLVGIVLVPLISFVFADVTALVIAIVISLRAHELVGNSLWQGDLWLQMQVMWVYVAVTTAIWYLPFIGWMLVVSAYVKRAPLLWSVLPFFVLFLAELLFLQSSYISHYIIHAISGYVDAAFRGDVNLKNSADITAGTSKLLDVAGFFTSPRVWAGAVVGGALIVAAIQIRMRRTES